MTRVGLLVPYTTAPTYALSTEAFEKLTTPNIGNLMFRYAATQHLKGRYVPVNFSADIDKLKASIDVIVYPTANLLSPGVKHFASLERFFKRLDKPALMIGLGAQSQTRERLEQKLPREGVQFFKTMSALSRKIGVRGTYTAEILERMGVKNTAVIGCPSNYVNADEELGAKIEHKLEHARARLDAPLRFSVFPQHGTNYLNDYHRASEAKLFAYALAHRGATYVVNGPTAYLAAARGHRGFIPQAERAALARFLGDTDEEGPFFDDFQRIARVYPAVEWLMEDLSRSAFAFGKRIHGAFAACQAGVPGIIIPHDARTDELAQTTLSPKISLEEFERTTSVGDVLDRVRFDGAAFDQRRRENFAVYRAMFAAHDVDVKMGG